MRTRALLLVFIVVSIAGVDAWVSRAGGPYAAAHASPAATAFTAEDMLKVVSVNVLDVSDGGQWIAAVSRRGLDNEPVDHRRYGDPTYVAPSRGRLVVIDTVAGKTVSPIDGLVDVRQAAWSHDGKRLAVTVVTRSGLEPLTTGNLTRSSQVSGSASDLGRRRPKDPAPETNGQ